MTLAALATGVIRDSYGSKRLVIPRAGRSIRGSHYRAVIRRSITLAFSAAVLAACGVAAASTVTARSSPAGSTIVITLPDDVAATTITVANAATSTALSLRDAADLRAALVDPSRITSIRDLRTRRKLATELRDLDAFISPRPKLQPYRAHLWYVAHHSRTPVTPRALAALLWCTVWFPHDCA